MTFPPSDELFDERNLNAIVDSLLQVFGDHAIDVARSQAALQARQAGISWKVITDALENTDPTASHQATRK